MLELDDIADVVASAVREATEPLLVRIDLLEKREIPREQVLALVGDYGPEISGLSERVKGLEERPGIEVPEIDRALVRELVESVSKEQIGVLAATLPLPEKGEPGGDGPPGEKGPPGDLGAPGKDGAGLADALIDKDGALVLTLSDGRTKTLGRVVGSDGSPGADGKTFSLADFDVVPIDERTIELQFTHGEEKHTFELEFPVPIYRNVFKEGESYQRGDMVTWAGSTWHCDEPKGLKPGAPDSGWTLAVKAGRPGKDK